MNNLPNNVSMEVPILAVREINCRDCKNFLRVSEDSRNISLRGFCCVGQCDGDYSLYINDSKSHSCKAFILDPYNSETYAMERKLNEKLDSYRQALCDKRSKLAKEIVKFGKAIGEYHTGGEHTVIGMFNDMHVAFEFFHATHKVEWLEIRRRAHLREFEYVAMMTSISTAINNHALELKAKKEAQACVTL